MGKKVEVLIIRLLLITMGTDYLPVASNLTVGQCLSMDRKQI